MSEDFSYEDKMEAGQRLMAIMDVTEDKEIQEALIATRDAMVASADLLRAHGLDDRTVFQLMLNTLAVPFLPS
jgi:hypothetical protein